MLTALAAYFIWVIYDTTIKFGQQPPVSPFIVMAIVGFISGACLTIFAAITHSLPKLRPTRWREQGLTAVSAAIMNLAIIIALKHLPLTFFYTLFFTTPLIIAILSVLLKHEVLTPVKVACLVSGFFGTVLAIGVYDGNGDITGYIAIAVGIMGFSSRALFVRHMGKSVTAESTLLLCYLFVGLTGVMGSLFHPLANGIEMQAFLIFALGGIAAVLGSLLYFRAIQNTFSTNVAQFQYTQIIFGAIFGYMLWHEIPTWNLIVGSLIIIGSGVALAVQSRNAKETAELKIRDD